MFYHHECLKKGGRFYLCWIANTWPRRFASFNSSRIKQVNIEELCQDLLEVMNSESFNPSQRFALRLSSQLVKGLVTIYAMHVQMFTYDIFHFDKAVKKRILDLQNPPTKVAKKHKTSVKESAPVEKEDPGNAILSEKELALMMNNTVMNVSTITLLDQVLPPSIIINDGFGDEVHPNIQFDATVEEVRTEEKAESVMEASTFNVKTPENLTDRPVSEIMKRRPFMLDVTVEKAVDDPTDVSMVNVPEIQIIPHLQTSVEITPVDTHRKIRKPIIEELILEPLEETAYPIMRRRRRSLVVDAQTMLDSESMKKRLGSCNVELRCLFASQDVIGLPRHTLRMESQWLITNPAVRAFNNGMLRTSADVHHRLFKRNLITRHAPDMKEKTFPVAREAVRAKRQSAKSPQLTINQSENKTLLPSLEKTNPIAMETVVSPTGVMQVQDKTLMPDISLDVIPELDSLMHQSDKINTTKGSDKKISKTTSAYENNDIHSLPKSPLAVHETTELQVSTAAVVEPTPVADENGQLLEISANGSADKTPVCLGDESLTEFDEVKMLLNEKWEPPEILKMINRARMDNVRPLTIGRLIDREYIPSIGLTKKSVACRVFYSILRLRKHRFVKITKLAGTIEIGHIRFGERLRELQN